MNCMDDEQIILTLWASGIKTGSKAFKALTYDDLSMMGMSEMNPTEELRKFVAEIERHACDHDPPNPYFGVSKDWEARQAKYRPSDYSKLSAREQWDIDKKLGIQGWDGS